jgi:hypothetical protein
MTRFALISTISATIACTAAVAESCGAMAFELPPEEPQAEAVPPPRLVRRDGGAKEPGASNDSVP